MPPGSLLPAYRPVAARMTRPTSQPAKMAVERASPPPFRSWDERAGPGGLVPLPLDSSHESMAVAGLRVVGEHSPQAEELAVRGVAAEEGADHLVGRARSEIGRASCRAKGERPGRG